MADSNSSHSQHSPSDYAPAAEDRVTDAAGSVNVAKYRLMSPAKLPISRSTCISVPPGLSPTSFLESPILLSNIKAEPSPTTGSFFKRQWMRGSGENAALSIGKIISSENTVDERMTSSFEFRFQTGVSSTSGISSAGLSIPVGLNQIGSVNQHNQRYSLSPAPSALASKAVDGGDLQDASVVGSTTDKLNQGHSNTGIIESSSEDKDSISSVSAEKTSDDGYNWRKYGQKLVKGSEFPRSYYKCTYPNCEVKKIFVRSPSGQITGIVYKGSHDHPKPQASRRHNLGALLPIQEDKLDKGLSISDQEGKLNATNMEQNVSPMFSPLQANKEENDCSDSQFQGLNDNGEADDPFVKRRKMEDSHDVTPVVKPIREPRVVVQTVSEVDILDDGYRWRKYGQKVVRGNPNPRSYYKCTHAGCPVRKHVERASHDPKAVITTYEGKHNHDVPTAKNSSNECAGIPRMRPQDGGSVCLDLGVGVGRSTEIITNKQSHALDDEAVRNQIGTNDSRTMAVRGSQIPPICYGRVNGGLNLYGNRENHVADRGFKTPSIHPSNQCLPNLGSIILGP